MLTELHIEHLGVIERATLVLGPGVTALTGETGAGKTMLVEAIELLVGARADPAMVRFGSEEARVDGRLEVRGSDGSLREVVVSRVVPAQGRSRAYVDGRPVTVAHLAELLDGAIDLHGQHAHQSLLSGVTQRAALDRFGAIDLEPLRAARARITEIQAELAALGGDERERAREIDLLRYQVAELDDADVVDPDEDLRLASEEATLAHAVAHREAAEAALDAVRGDGGIGDRLPEVLLLLGDREPFAEFVDRLRAVIAEIDDLTAGVRTRAETIEEDPERLAEIRRRRQTLTDLRRKYGDDLAAVMAFHAGAADRLRELLEYDRRAAGLDEVLSAAIAAERVEARRVGEARRHAAPLLASAVTERLRHLAMPDAHVAIEVGAHADDHPGDDVRFLLAANPGSPLLPLNRVASGGELARAMLALRLVLSEAGSSAGAATIVFDEVDAGVGGAAAVAVGAALADLGRHHQVLIVTHLAQVAALASTHLVVSKSVDGGSTSTSVRCLTDEDRAVEVARMLSGDTSPAAVEHARALLAR